MRKSLLKLLVIFVIGTFGGIFADQILWPYFIERPLFLKYRLEQTPIYLTEIKEVTIQENVALKNVIEKVEKAVIGIEATTKETILRGSGLILTSDGLIVTLSDLVPQGAKINFFVDGQLASFQVLKRDLKENLALIKVENTNLSTLGFANLERIKLGERVFILGMILKGGKIQKTVNEGIVKRFSEEWIDTNILETASLAGSPLFNIEGGVLGINTVDYWGRVNTIPVTKIKEFAGF